MLFIVGTPIGNLKDITYRAIETLKSVDLILAEDTRKSQVLLKAYSIQTKLTSFHRFNEKNKESFVINLLRSGKNIALISDAGMPLICDPGSRLVKECNNLEFKVTVIPGPSAITTALSLYGSDKSFQFVGFLMKNEVKQMIDIVYYNGLTVAFDTPHNIKNTLKIMHQISPNQRIFIARELTKVFEESLYKTPQELLDYFNLHKKKCVGEFVVIFKGNHQIDNVEKPQFVVKLQEEFNLTKKEALAAAAKILNVPKKKLYNLISRK